MTTRATDVSVTLVAKDRMSPVLQNARRNVGRMSSSVVAMNSSMGAMSTQMSGVLGPMVGLVGGMGLLGLAVTGVGVGLSLGIKRLKAWRSESKASQEAAESFRNRLMLSGFSADTATRSVDELRSSLGRLAFQSLPGLDFEMQGFIANMDEATRSQFGNFVELLTDKGVDASKALAAVGEALQGNFGPISQLLNRPISSFAEFSREMQRLGDQAIEMDSKVLGALRELGAGTGDFGKLSNEVWDGLANDLDDTAQAFGVHQDLVRSILATLSEEDRANLLDHLIANKERRQADNDYKGSLQVNTDILIGLLSGALDANEEWSGSVQTETEKAIQAWRFVNPEVRTELQKLNDAYISGTIDLARFRVGVQTLLEQSEGQYGDFADAAIAQLERVARATRAVAGVPQRTIAEADGIGATVNTGGQLGGPDVAFDEGSFFNRQTSGGKVSAPLSIRLGDRVIADLVVEALGEELSIREPGIGIG